MNCIDNLPLFGGPNPPVGHDIRLSPGRAGFKALEAASVLQIKSELDLRQKWFEPARIHACALFSVSPHPVRHQIRNCTRHLDLGSIPGGRTFVVVFLCARRRKIGTYRS